MVAMQSLDMEMDSGNVLRAVIGVNGQGCGRLSAPTWADGTATDTRGHRHRRQEPLNVLALPPAVGPVAGWRLLGRADIGAITALVDASRRYEGKADDIPGMAELAHATFGRPGVDAGSVIGGVDRDGGLLAWGSVWCRPGAPAIGRAVLSGDVHPLVRRRGIGGVLLAWQESRARDRFSAELPAHLPRRIDVYARRGRS